MAKSRKEYHKEYYLKNKEKLIANSKKWQKENKEKYIEYLKNYQLENKDKINTYYKEWYNNGGKEYQENYYLDGYYSVYLLPKENYVGQTKKIKARMADHRYNGRDTSDYKILHTFATRKEAIAKEKEYHAMGYNG